MTPHGASAPRPWAGLDPLVTVLAPPTEQSFSGFLDATSGPQGEPFAAERIEALGALSAAFLADPVLRRDAASTAAAYWLRPAHLARLAKEFRHRTRDDVSVVRVPAGRVFHLAPSNVDTLFLYSWGLAFLCGNANVVRLSQDRSPVVDAMMRAIGGVAAEHAVLLGHDRFVTYAHDAEASAAISLWCNHRVIWGGDETVAALRPLALNPHASERVFGSKFSYSVIGAARYLGAGSGGQAQLAGRFFNDMFWFDQMACSSPQAVFWVGGEVEARSAMDRFEESLQAEAERRGYEPSAANAVHRRTFAFELAADAEVEVELRHPAFIGVRAADAEALGREICGGGIIRHHRLDRLEDLTRFARESDQTVTHFGLEPDQLATLAAGLGARGVDRVVPVGEALLFDVVWDGFDLIDDFTRRVRVKTA